MKWIKKPKTYFVPEKQERVIGKFLFLPLSIPIPSYKGGGTETRWLEFTKIKQVWKSSCDVAPSWGGKWTNHSFQK